MRKRGKKKKRKEIKNKEIMGKFFKWLYLMGFINYSVNFIFFMWDKEKVYIVNIEKGEKFSKWKE